MARSHILQNASGAKILAIICSKTILNLESIDDALSATHMPVTGQAVEEFLHQCGLDSMAAMPKLGNLPTIVDQRLLSYDTLLLSIGVDNQHIQIDQESFQQLVGSTTVADISSPLAPLTLVIPTDEDVARIENSVDQFTERRVKQRLEETLEFPPLPETAQQIIKLRVDPNADIADLSEIVEIDASLSAQVVSWAASPYYSAPGAIKSIHDAIARVLGFDMVMNLSLGLALGSTLKMPAERPNSVIPYWQQSVFVAASTEALITKIPREHRPSYGTAYLSGLLHNFGYLILGEVFTAQFKSICHHIDANPHVCTEAIEQHIVGVDRNQLASWLMESWYMPEEVCVALRQQGNPGYDGDHWQYALLIFAARKLLAEQGLITGTSDAAIDDSVFKRLHITREDAVSAITKVLEGREELQIMAKQMEG